MRMSEETERRREKSSRNNFIGVTMDIYEKILLVKNEIEPEELFTATALSSKSKCGLVYFF